MVNDPDTVRRLLERDLIERSEDPDLRLIWADLLQLEGDPLGTLVVLDHVGARAEAEALRGQLRARLWDEAIPDNPGVTLVWRLGFVCELQICADRLRRPTAAEVASLVGKLLRQPALRWVEVVRIEVDDVHARQWSQWLLHARLHNPILREIHVGRPATLRERPQGAWELNRDRGNWSRIDAGPIQGLRQLQQLSRGGVRVRLPCRDGNPQTRARHVVRLATRSLTSENRVSLARALWDESVLVHAAAFQVARALGPRAAFLLDELAWFLRPPLSKKDPRPLAALQVLTAIGPTSAALLGEVLARPHELLEHHRIIVFMNWLTALGPAAAMARPVLDSLLDGGDRVISPAGRKAIAHARRAIESPQ